jgi:alkanesulfonate monooxygenase SsuD/methylene tetrahydromethanopterin reductase-like flavin-dependent oxidoreductase (luciferase family)
MALRRETVRYRGRTLTLPLEASDGLAMRIAVGAVQERLPIFVAALGPDAITLAGEIADGWLAIHAPPEHLKDCRKLLEAGARRAGRSLDGFEVAPMVLTLVDEDLDLARDMLRPSLAMYVGGMGSRQTNFYNRFVRRLGFPEAAAAVQDAYLQGRHGEAMDALPEELIDLVTLCGPMERVRARLHAYREAGATTLIVSSVAPTPRDRLEQLALIAQAARQET